MGLLSFLDPEPCKYCGKRDKCSFSEKAIAHQKVLCVKFEVKR